MEHPLWPKWSSLFLKQKEVPLKDFFNSADCRDRTCDLRVTSALLYQLS